MSAAHDSILQLLEDGSDTELVFASLEGAAAATAEQGAAPVVVEQTTAEASESCVVPGHISDPVVQSSEGRHKCS